MSRPAGGARHRAVDLRQAAEQCLGLAVDAVRELPAPRSTSYALRRLALDLADGRTLDVFLKDFDESPHPADVALRRGSRERRVYEAILAGSDLGTPELYGVVWDDSRDRHWLLLEFVEGRKLSRSSTDDLVAAAGWLGRLQGCVAGRPAELAESGFLLGYDAAYFRDTAERAVQAVASRPGSLQRRLQAAVSGYDSVVETVCSAPPTLVHGSYRPLNILVDARTAPPRLCPVDWELAAVGPPLHDLAFIADGSERPVVERLCGCYAEGAAKSGLAVPPIDEMLAEVERLRLHKALRSLARSGEWAYSDRAVTRLVATAEAIRSGLW